MVSVRARRSCFVGELCVAARSLRMRTLRYFKFELLLHVLPIDPLFLQVCWSKDLRATFSGYPRFHIEIVERRVTLSNYFMDREGGF